MSPPLAAVYKEARSLGPTLIVLEDLDQIVADRRQRGDTRALSEFLAVMDIDPCAPILTLASTNDVNALDAASFRTARFDAIIEIGYPVRGAAAQILATYLRGVPGFESFETDAVAANFGPETSGADIREIVRRTVLSTGALTQADPTQARPWPAAPAHWVPRGSATRRSLIASRRCCQATPRAIPGSPQSTVP